MSQIRPRLPVGVLVLLAALIPTLLLAASGKHMFMVAPGLHIAVVGVASALAVAASVVMSVIAMRRRDVHALWLGMGFSVMATLLLIHALATPGIILPGNGLVQLAGALNLPIGGTILAASGLSVLRSPRRIKLLLGLQLAVVGELALAGTLILVAAPVIPSIPAPSSTEATVIFILGASPLVLLAWRAARTYLLTRRPADLIVAHGVVWLIGAQYALLHFTMMQAGFWAAHVLEVGGIGMVAIPAALDLRHAVGSRPLAGDLRASDLVEHEEAFLGGRVRAILLRLGEKDPSTEGHTRRVALLAVAIGERLGLAEGRLRQLALGGLLHDVGKLSVPNEILNKPGRLTDAEFAEIRRHPGAGRELLNELGGFPPLVLDLVESHHERLDGDGYPNHV
ncbi:MAG: HD domain-containing phosphohydrolase, partial [Solirubrobacteraceae bacterium]